MDQDSATTVNAAELVALTSKPCKWIAVIRQGTRKSEVESYMNRWPVFVVSDYGMFIVCIPADQTWYADRLASGLFYARVHDTYGEAEADLVANADLIR
jgi:hypothetical protein